MLIGFDFDGVLFDTDSFKERLEESIEDFSETYNLARDKNNYDPEKHAKILGISTKDILGVISDTESFLFEDVEEIERLKDKHRIIIVTRGNEKFQREKIQRSGILDFINEYIIIDKSIKRFPKDKTGIDLLIDDSEEETDAVEIDSIHFDRSNGSLKDAVNLIEEQYSD